MQAREELCPAVGESAGAQEAAPRRRADARRNVDALLGVAKEVFAEAGVDAPAKQITDRAGVGVGTLYRHFPQRSELVVAVLRREIDACVRAAADLGAAEQPGTALVMWLDVYTAFLSTKHGLARALQSDDPAYAALRTHFDETMAPALRPLLAVAVAAGGVRDDLTAEELLRAVALLALPVPDDRPESAPRRVAVFVDGLGRPRTPR